MYSSRYYYDPPEMMTVICESTYKTGFHIGYFRDSPKDAPVFLVSGVESEGCKLNILGNVATKGIHEVTYF